MMHLTQGAIVTHRTSRYIVAECFNGKHQKPIDHSLSNGQLHATAAMELVAKLASKFAASHGQTEWINAPQCGRWVAGDSPKDSGFSFVYSGASNATSGMTSNGFIQNCEGNKAKA